MAGNYRITEPTDDDPKVALRSLTRQLNDLFAQLESDQTTRLGAEGPLTLADDLDAGTKRLKRVAPSQEGTDAVNRDEVQQLIRTERTQRTRQRPIVRAIGDGSTGTGGTTFAATGDATTNNNFAACARKLNQIIDLLNSL